MQATVPRRSVSPEQSRATTVAPPQQNNSLITPRSKAREEARIRRREQDFDSPGVAKKPRRSVSPSPAPARNPKPILKKPGTPRSEKKRTAAFSVGGHTERTYQLGSDEKEGKKAAWRAVQVNLSLEEEDDDDELLALLSDVATDLNQAHHEQAESLEEEEDDDDELLALLSVEAQPEAADPQLASAVASLATDASARKDDVARIDGQLLQAASTLGSASENISWRAVKQSKKQSRKEQQKEQANEAPARDHLRPCRGVPPEGTRRHRILCDVLL